MSLLHKVLKDEPDDCRDSHLWAYSIQNMNLNSSRLIAEWTFLNSGEARYRSYSACQSSGDIGGRSPVRESTRCATTKQRRDRGEKNDHQDLTCEFPFCHGKARSGEACHTAKHNHAVYPSSCTSQPPDQLLAGAIRQPTAEGFRPVVPQPTACSATP